jgi:hypothetical protein
MPTTHDLIRRASTADDKRVDAVHRLFTGLGWAPGIRAVDAQVGDSKLLELSWGDEPQALVVLATDTDSVRGVSWGYSRETPYALLWSEDRLELQDTRSWRQTPGDRPLLATDPDDRWAAEALLDLLVPREVLDDIPASYGDPSHRQRELHETLSQALLSLRVEVADAGLMRREDPDRRDTAVLRLFHQLLFIRFQEDRDEAQSEVLLRELSEEDDVRSSVQRALSDYELRLNSSLFESAGIDVQQLPASALWTVIHQMVEPWARLKLNFSVSRSEIAGRLYQSYLRSLPVRSPKKTQTALFERALPVDEREKSASYYTPPGLARLVVERTLRPWLSAHKPQAPSEVRVLDPACGSGAFLIAAYRELLTYFERNKARALRPKEREDILLTCVFGADVDERALGLAQIQLLEEAHVGGKLPVMGDNLLLGDSLPAPPGRKAAGGQVNWSHVLTSPDGFDVVLTNPPFGASIKLPARIQVADLHHLRDLYPEVYTGHSDYAYIFVALSLRLLRRGGAAGFVLTRTILDAASGESTRELLSKQGVRSIIDFRAGELFDIRGYVCTIATGPARQVEVAGAVDSRIDGRTLIQAVDTKNSPYIRRQRVQSTTVKTQVGEGWGDFRLRWNLELIAEIGADLSPFVSEDDENRIARFGTKPAALSKFVVKPSEWTAGRAGQILVGDNALPEQFIPFMLKGAQISPFCVHATGERLFLPFDVDGSLTANVGVLEELRRRGGLPRHVQRGDLQTLTAPKLLLRTFSQEPATVADPNAEWMPLMGTAGAIAIRLDDVASDDLYAYEALLNAALYQWLIQGLGRPRHGGWTELTISDVNKLPVPALEDKDLTQLKRHSLTIRSTLAEPDPMLRRTLYHAGYKELDNTVFDLVKASKRLRHIVTEELVRVV